MAKTSNSNQLKIQKAMAAAQQGRFAEAEKLLQGLVRKKAANAAVWYLLGAIRGQLGDPVQAETYSRRAIGLQKNNADVWYNLGNALQNQARHAEAIDAFQSALRLQPELVKARVMLGNALDDSGRLGEALASFQAALNIDPGIVEAWCNIGKVQSNLGQIQNSIASYRKAVELAPSLHDARNQLAAQLSSSGRPEEALALLDATPGGVTSPMLITVKAEVLDKLGQFEQAQALLEPLFDGTNTDVSVALAHARFCHHSGGCDNTIQSLREIVAQKRAIPDLLVQAHFALANLLDRSKQYDEAFAHYRQGNAQKQVRLRYNPESTSAQVDQLIELLPHLNRGELQSSSFSDATPVFIVGMPRSGTSLVEQIVASHSQVEGAGELTAISDIVQGFIKEPDAAAYPALIADLGSEQLSAAAQVYLQKLREFSSEATFITDKMPPNFTHLILIRMLFPKARIIHCQRDPVDTCLSCYFQNFTLSYVWTNDLGYLGHYYNDYQRWMAAWDKQPALPTLNVSYEALVADQEKVSREMLEFLGLPWEQDCLDFHRSKRKVNTASYDQVRQPIYQKSVNRWEHYREHLQPLMEVLDVG